MGDDTMVMEVLRGRYHGTTGMSFIPFFFFLDLVDGAWKRERYPGREGWMNGVVVLLDARVFHYSLALTERERRTRFLL